MGTRCIIRQDKLSSVVRRSSGTTEEYSSLRLNLSSRKFSLGKKTFFLYKDLRDFWFIKPDAIQRILTFYKEILIFSNTQTMSVVFKKSIVMFYSK